MVVSTRLPITVEEQKGKLIFHECAGGLVSGLSAYLDSLKGSSFTKSDYIWVGWPGISIEQKMQDELTTKTLSEFRAYPVFLTERSMEKFYQGFCNKTIWPLFHYFPSYTVYDESFWLHYKCVNKIFCDAVMQVIKPGDVVWIHDYHLMLLPKLLREEMPDIPIEFFLSDHVTKAETFPMGIDFQRFYTAAGCSEVQKEKEQLVKTLSDCKVVLSIDRLDYTKAIINRLQAYEVFLEKNPQWHKKVILFLVVVPSRIGVEHYQQIKKQIDEFVGKVNGRFGDGGWTPIIYQYRFVPFHPLVSFYAVSDVALITPVRDGMNLIVKEYIATRTDKTGVLILSEMAGAAKELGEAIIINPNNIQEIADALKEALEMPKDKQTKVNEIMQNRLMRYDGVRWADDFIRQLLCAKDEQKKFNAKLLGLSVKEQLLKDFKKAPKRLIFLDYDGTLVPFTRFPQMAKPSEELLKILKELSKNPTIKLVLMSGRDKDTLQSWFGALNIAIVAEHGVWIKEKNDNWRLI